MRIIIGAGRTAFPGWIATQEDELNLLKREDFARILGGEKAGAFLAEHVWEHMTEEEGRLAARNIYEFLAEGGYIRVAVPDANFRSDWYQNMVKPGGNGDPNHPAYSHRIVYDYKTLRAVFEAAGFECELLEYCDENGDFHYKYWNEADGHIGRSLRFDTRNSQAEGRLGMVSVIMDAKKQGVIRQGE